MWPWGKCGDRWRLQAPLIVSSRKSLFFLVSGQIGNWSCRDTSGKIKRVKWDARFSAIRTMMWSWCSGWEGGGGGGGHEGCLTDQPWSPVAAPSVIVNTCLPPREPRDATHYSFLHVATRASTQYPYTLAGISAYMDHAPLCPVLNITSRSTLPQRCGRIENRKWVIRA